MFTRADATAPPAGAIVEHVGFIVKDMPGALVRWERAGVTVEPTENPNEADVRAPDGTRVEVYEAAAHRLRRMKSFSPGTKPPEPARGTALDHIRFDVGDLDAFAASLEATGIRLDAPIRQDPGTTATRAFLTDPPDTRIELTEGLPPQEATWSE